MRSRAIRSWLLLLLVGYWLWPSGTSEEMQTDTTEEPAPPPAPKRTTPRTTPRQQPAAQQPTATQPTTEEILRQKGEEILRQKAEELLKDQKKKPGRGKGRR